MKDTLPLLVIHTGDEDIKLMLAQHSIHMQKPEPPNDLAVCEVEDRGFVWLVFKFFRSGDGGYCAYGLPQSIPESERFEVWAYILETIGQSAALKGINAFAESKVIPLPSVTVN